MTVRLKKEYEDKWTRARYKHKNDSAGNRIVFCCGKTGDDKKVNEETNITV
jgi:hypothetical protein